MFIVSVRYVQPIEEINRLLAAHRAFLQKHYDAGNLLMSGPQEPRTGGIIVACVKTRAEMDAIIAQDPFCVNKVAEYTVTEFKPVLTAPVLAAFQEKP